MKILHLSDLHLGKRVNEFSMLEDQEYILQRILEIVDGQRPDAIVMAGDIYDKSVPSAEAVTLFDEFLSRLSSRNSKVFIISGNHDSPERLAFASRLIAKSGIYLSPVYRGKVEPVVLTDEYGEIAFYMLPFIKPAHVRRFFPEEEIDTYTDALRAAIAGMEIDQNRRNVLVTHQFVTGATRSESEEISVGGTDNVDASVFEGFDYVALGHIHGPQNIGSERIRYCGTPLKYSFSEAKHKKSVTVVILREKGSLDLSFIPLIPRRDMREIKGSYAELTAKSYYEGMNREDYLHITLTDEEDIPEGMARLRVIYPNLMKLDYDNTRTRSSTKVESSAGAEAYSPLELFGRLYELQNGSRPSEEQEAFLEKLAGEIWS